MQKPPDGPERPEPASKEPEPADMVAASPLPAPAREVTRTGIRNNPSSDSINTSSLPPREQRNLSYTVSVVHPEDIVSLKTMDREFVATISTDLYHVREHPNTLSYACAVRQPKPQRRPRRDEEAIKILLYYMKSMASPQVKKRKIVIDNEMNSLKRQ